MERKRNVMRRAPCKATEGSTPVNQEAERSEGKAKATAFIGISMGSKAGQGKQLRIS